MYELMYLHEFDTFLSIDFFGISFSSVNFFLYQESSHPLISSDPSAIQWITDGFDMDECPNGLWMVWMKILKADRMVVLVRISIHNHVNFHP